jgi:hypothetical protein
MGFHVAKVIGGTLVSGTAATGPVPTVIAAASEHR